MRVRGYRFDRCVGVGVTFEWGAWSGTRTLRVALGFWAVALMWDRSAGYDIDEAVS